MTKLLIAALMLVGACGGGGGKPAPSGAGGTQLVNLGDWCKGLTPVACDRVATCAGAPDMANSCTESGLTSCLGGRDAGRASGHDRAELDACVAIVKAAACESFVDTLAAHTECQADAE